MRRTVAVLALFAALSVTGCSMTSAGPGGADDEATVSAGPLSKEDAATQFQQITSAYDGVVSQFDTAMKSDAPLEEQTGLAMATGAALHAEAEGLRQTDWPEDLADAAATLAESSEEAAHHWEMVAEAETAKELKKHVKAAKEAIGDEAEEAEATIREALDLPAD